MKKVIKIGCLSLLSLAPISTGFAQSPNPSTSDYTRLKSLLQQEVKIAKEQGYVPHATIYLMEKAQGKWKEAENIRRAGKDKKKAEALSQEARKLLVWAKGALMDLKLPKWAHDVSYYGPGDQMIDPDRGVVFVGTDLWALPGAFPGQWFRAHCRPHSKGPEQIEAIRLRGSRVGTYMSGGMMPITYVLLPENEEDWTTDFMKKYAGAYWHYGERWWGATGDKAGFRAWMLPHIEFAKQAGFDFIHLDEAWGGYPEAREFNDHNPGFLVVTNNFAMTYVDQESFRFGWTAMGEGVGSVRDWDNFQKRLRERALKANNLTTWSWLYYAGEFPEPEVYHNLAYATAIANKTANVSEVKPSRNYVAFAHRFRDYLFGPYVDIDVPEETMRIVSGSSSVRALMTRRFLLSGTEELIIHFFNIKPEFEEFTGEIEVEVNLKGLRLPSGPLVTFASPESEAQTVAAVSKGNKLTFKVPGVKVWGIAVIGESLFPRVSLRLVSRGGKSILHPLDNSLVPGEEFEIGVKTERIAPQQERFTLELVLPTGWKSQPIGKTKQESRFLIRPSASAPLHRGYVITPLIRKADEAMPSFPLQLETKEQLTFRLFPPCIDSPATKPSDFELEVKNNSLESLANVKIEAPESWKVEPKEFKVELAPGETKRFPFTMWAPDMKVSFWFHKDVKLTLQWQLNHKSGSSRLGVRVFPALFSVYHEGVEKLIMHGYPNIYFRGNDFEAAKRRLQAGEYVALWLVNQDPEKFAPIVDWFLANGGGVVWMGKPFAGENCPVALEAEKIKPKSISLLGGDDPFRRIAAPVQRFKSYYESEKGFEAYKVKPKEWAQISAIWGPDGSPAIVISTDPKRRIVYIASDLETTTENSYHFEDRLHRQNHWYLTYYFYHLLAWASGTEG